MITLRHYQKDIFNQVLQAVSSGLNPLVQLDTGAGKTPIIGELCKQFDNFIVIAHRNFLIRQASETLSKMKVEHDVLASQHTRNLCVVSALNQNTNLISSTNKLVASVDTLLSRKKRNKLHFNPDLDWIVFIDEAHHALDDNKWGILKRTLPFSKFIGVTATPMRADGRSLEAQSGGLFDCIVQAEELKSNSVATLIENGYLSNFKCYLHELPRGLKKSDYDYQGFEQTKQFEDKYICGEYVKSYKRLAKDKRAIVMCKSIKEAELVAAVFKENNCSAKCISSKMTQAEVSKIIEDFKFGIVKILCNVAMVDEGFDVPAAECLIMLRTTNFRTYRQWVGRVLRPKPTPAIIIDHADNLVMHGLPNLAVNWTLYRKNHYKHNLIDCIKCGFVFHCDKLKCPECGHVIKVDEEKQRVLVDNSRYREVMIASLRRFIQRDAENKQRIKMRSAHKYEIMVPQIIGNGFMFSVIRNLAKWFASSMELNIKKKIVDYESVNDFMKTNFNSKDFWLNNFVADDATKINAVKCLDVYKKYNGKLL